MHTHLPSLLLQVPVNFMVFDKIELLQLLYLWWCCMQKLHICCTHVCGVTCCLLAGVHHGMPVYSFFIIATLSIQHYHMCTCTLILSFLPPPQPLPFYIPSLFRFPLSPIAPFLSLFSSPLSVFLSSLFPSHSLSPPLFPHLQLALTSPIPTHPHDYTLSWGQQHFTFQ